jgi:cobalamin synthase
MINDSLKDFDMRVFAIHLAAFIVGVAVAAAINLWRTPDTLWWPWVLIGWGAAVTIHGFALLLRKVHRRERIFIDRKARTWAVHFFAYLVTVLILFYVNLTVTPKVWWFYWVALGWGAGVAFQGWCTFWKHRRKRPQRQTATAKAPAASPKTRSSKAKPRKRRVAKRSARKRSTK